MITPEGFKIAGAQPWCKAARLDRRRAEAAKLGVSLTVYMGLRKDNPGELNKLLRAMERRDTGRKLTARVKRGIARRVASAAQRVMGALRARKAARAQRRQYA